MTFAFVYEGVVQSPNRATSMPQTSKPGSPVVIQLAMARPTPPPWLRPAITPQATQWPRWPRMGPISGFPSGAKVNGPFTTFLMPASANIGKCSNAAASDGAIRSRSGVRSWDPKSQGVSVVDQGTHAFS